MQSFTSTRLQKSFLNERPATKPNLSIKRTAFGVRLSPTLGMQ